MNNKNNITKDYYLNNHDDYHNLKNNINNNNIYNNVYYNIYNNLENNKNDIYSNFYDNCYHDLNSDLSSNKNNNKNISTQNKNKSFENFKEDKGNIFGGISILMVFSTIIMVILLLNLYLSYGEINTYSLNSNSFNYLIEDYKKNIPVLGREVLEKASEEVINSSIPLDDASKEIKERLEEKLNSKNDEYYQRNKIHISSEIVSVKSSEDPFYIEISTILSCYKDDLSFNQTIKSEISIIDLKDPLGFVICGKDPSFSYDENKINYGLSLAKYLNESGINGSSYYINASSPLKIKKCIYDPYIQHGIGITLKNCIENGYYHESADGACYLHRLEGIGYCSNYGLETFILPNKNLNQTNLKSVSASDHVVFHDHYLGTSLIFYSYNDLNEVIFLDESHKLKYGIS
jgi:hypothetical protein